MSALMPGAIIPLSSSRNACAPFTVAAHKASSGVIPQLIQAQDTANCIFQHGDVPGLKSVANATGTPIDMYSLTGGYFRKPRK